MTVVHNILNGEVSASREVELAEAA